MIEVPDSAFAPLTDRSKPLHCFDHEEYQYRVKVQAFSSTPPEITIQGISLRGISLLIVVPMKTVLNTVLGVLVVFVFRQKVGLLMRIWSALDVELKLAFESW